VEFVGAARDGLRIPRIGAFPDRCADADRSRTGDDRRCGDVVGVPLWRTRLRYDGTHRASDRGQCGRPASAQTKDRRGNPQDIRPRQRDYERARAHLLRDVRDLRVAHSAASAVQAWAAGTHNVHQQAVAWEAVQVEASITAQKAASELFAAAIERTDGEVSHGLFVFVEESAVSPDNNEAERALRHLVTNGNISGGTRSTRGSERETTLTSPFGTWRRRGENPYRSCRALLVSLQDTKYDVM
jgi:hypothetical protein